jgi:hypothetical protein
MNNILKLIIVILIIASVRWIIKNMSSSKKESNYVVLTITPGVDPMVRESKYGDPINIALQQKSIGEVTGGGTMLDKPDQNGKSQLLFSDIEINFISREKENLLVLLKLIRDVEYPEDTQIRLWDSQDLVFNNVTSFEEYLKVL